MVIRLSDFPKNRSEKIRNFRVEADYYGDSEPQNFGFPSKPTRKYAHYYGNSTFGFPEKPIRKTRYSRVEADYYGDSEPENIRANAENWRTTIATPNQKFRIEAGARSATKLVWFIDVLPGGNTGNLPCGTSTWPQSTWPQSTLRHSEVSIVYTSTSEPNTAKKTIFQKLENCIFGKHQCWKTAKTAAPHGK